MAKPADCHRSSYIFADVKGKDGAVTTARHLQVVMLPYLAFGHMIPFLELSIPSAKQEFMSPSSLHREI